MLGDFLTHWIDISFLPELEHHRASKRTRAFHKYRHLLVEVHDAARRHRPAQNDAPRIARRVDLLARHARLVHHDQPKVRQQHQVPLRHPHRVRVRHTLAGHQDRRDVLVHFCFARVLGISERFVDYAHFLMNKQLGRGRENKPVGSSRRGVHFS